MTNRTNSIFVVGVPDSDPAPRQQPAPQPTTRNQATGFAPGTWTDRYEIAPRPATNASAPSSVIPTTTPRTTMTFPRQTQQQIDAESLRELTAISTNKALAALNTNPVEAATALRAAVGYADRLLAVNAEFAVNSARQANEFHGYDVNNPTAGAQRAFVPNAGGYDLNNPEGV